MAEQIFTIDSQFGHWLAGFVAGEGSFCILKNSRGARYCMLRISLHHEDQAILDQISEQTGIGNVTVQNSPSQKPPCAIWSVTNKAGCLRAVEIFESFPLLNKKQIDFEIWAEAVREWNLPAEFRDWGRIDYLRDELRSGRPSRGKEAWVI